MNPRDLARFLESTILKPDATADAVRRLCAEAQALGVYGVCVNPCRVALAAHCLEASDIKVVTVVGFPLGATAADAKRFETEAALDDGAQEIDLVMNLGWLKDGADGAVVREIRDVVEAADHRPVKVILETGLLTREEIVRGCRLAVEAEAHCVKTSTGFGPRGASVADVQLLRETAGPGFGIKAAGGIRDVEAALALIAAGATRIGTSAAAAILRGAAHPPVL